MYMCKFTQVWYVTRIKARAIDLMVLFEAEEETDHWWKQGKSQQARSQSSKVQKDMNTYRHMIKIHQSSTELFYMGT
jgi:hypothetical protein